MNGPYINTELHTTVSLMPNQMDNAIYINLKENLKRQVAKKCLKNYGYIVEVYEITEYKGGIIEAENFLASSKFDISFSCRLCARAVPPCCPSTASIQPSSSPCPKMPPPGAIVSTRSS